MGGHDLARVAGLPDGVAHRGGELCARWALQEAGSARERLQKLDPGLRISNLEDELGPYHQRDYVARYAEGLRAAGLPD